MSSELPAANGTITRIGRDGHAWANPAPGSEAVARAAVESLMNWRRVLIPVSWICPWTFFGMRFLCLRFFRLDCFC
jgi:hypothetical protein